MGIKKEAVLWYPLDVQPFFSYVLLSEDGYELLHVEYFYAQF